ncbi:Putative ribonuclease H protein At1g65750, partial [Linum grandiflorum]
SCFLSPKIKCWGSALRNHSGDCLLTFTANYGRCSITRAELSAIADGLTLAWNWGARRVAIQTDSLAASKLLQQRDNPDHQHASLVLQFQQLLRREWEVKLFHVYREGNCLADHLVGRGHGLPLGTHPVDVSDPAVASWLAYDRLRSSQPRLVLR